MSASGQEPQASENSPAAGGAVTIDIASYANLCGSWKYQEIEDGQKQLWTTACLGTRTKAGKPVYLVQEFDEDGSRNDQEFLSADLSRGLYHTGGLNDYGQKTEETWFWNPSIPKLMKVFVPGVTYTSKPTRNDMQGTAIEMRVTTVEDTIAVPYGKNIHCYKVTQTFSFNREKYVFQTWYAKHLGLVKRIQEDDTLWELVSYQPAPWLVVEQPAGSALFDSVSKMSFGTRAVGKAGVTKTFKIRNPGTKSLTGISLKFDGIHAADFMEKRPPATTVAPGGATTFEVIFKPASQGTRKAAIHIAHDESKGNPFDIAVSGMGAK